MRRHELEERKEALTNGVDHLRHEIEQMKMMLQQREVDLIATQGALQEINLWLSHSEMMATNKDDDEGMLKDED